MNKELENSANNNVPHTEISDKELLDWLDNQISDYKDLVDREENPYNSWYVNENLVNRYKYELAMFEKIKNIFVEKIDQFSTLDKRNVSVDEI